MLRKRTLTVLFVATTLVGCQNQAQPVDPLAPDGYEPATTPLVADSVVAADQIGCTTLTSGINTWFHAYALSRVIPVTTSAAEPLAFGPWSAAKDYGATDAREDGSLTEWADSYYVTHDWSDFGKQILTMVPGDTVTINGRTITIHGVFNYPKDSYYEEVTEVTGKDAMVLQTCYPDSEENRIAYGW